MRKIEKKGKVLIIQYDLALKKKDKIIAEKEAYIKRQNSVIRRLGSEFKLAKETIFTYLNSDKVLYKNDKGKVVQNLPTHIKETIIGLFKVTYKDLS